MPNLSPVYRALSILSAEEFREIEDYFMQDKHSNLYLLSDLELMDPRVGLVTSRACGSLCGIPLRLDLPEFPILWLLGSVDGTRSLVREMMDEKFVMITEDLPHLAMCEKWAEAGHSKST